MKLMKNIAALHFANSVLLVLLCACTVQTTPSLLTSTSTGSADTVNKIIEAVPFAYDLAVDTISYNSCVGVGLNAAGIHGFKIGANEGFVEADGKGAVKGGLKLRTDFLQYLGKNITPNFPNTAIVPSQIQYILQNSLNNMSTPANPQLFVQYAVRTASDLNVVPDVINKNPPPAVAQNRDGVYEYSSMTEDSVLTAVSNSVTFGPGGTVLSAGPRIYNIGSKSSPKAFEASLGYSSIIDESFRQVDGADDNLGAGEQYSDLVRAQFNSGSYVLAVTYGNPATIASGDISGASFGLNAPKRKTGASPNRAFGRAFELTFVSKNAARSSQRKNVLSNVKEKNLEDGAPVADASWQCENVVIMKTGEWNNKKISEPACSELTAADMIPPMPPAVDQKIKGRVAKLRRHYPESQWGIGLFFDRKSDPTIRAGKALCLVNKATDCYLPTVGLIASAPAEDIGVEYDYSKDCYLSRFARMGVSYVGNLTGDAARRLRRCPQYASICIRTSTSY